MIELARTIRFAINDTPPADSDQPYNSYAGYPAMCGLGRHYELVIRCLGETDPETGLFINIKEIDRIARRCAIPIIAEACRTAPRTEPAGLMPGLLASLDHALAGRLSSLCWRLTPTYCIEMDKQHPDTVLLRQRFEFAAAHRLHASDLSERDNESTFGKCNNPHGHGHNYHVEPCVEVNPNQPNHFTLGDLERITHHTIIERFDHKNLSLDLDEFTQGNGLNPTVENIARVIHHLLAKALEDHTPTARLRSVTVWETEKTSCTYPAPPLPPITPPHPSPPSPTRD